jgi:phage shock protein A
MGIIQRLIRLCKADLNAAVDHMEDQRVLLKQYIRDMQASLGKKQTAVRELNRRCDQTNRSLKRCREEMNALDPEITTAIQKARDDLARPLIRRHQLLGRRGSLLERQIEDLTIEHQRQMGMIAEQRQALEAIRLRAMAIGPRPPAGEENWEGAILDDMDPSGQVGGDEAVELELIQRKAALQSAAGP